MRAPIIAAVIAGLAALPAAPAFAADDWPPKPLLSSTMEWKVSAEVGYRSLDLDGSEELYRSHTNTDEGARLFGLSLRGTPRGPASRFLDTLEVNASGLGGDPQEWVHFTMRKRGAYRWDARFNQSDYFFSVPSFALGQHVNRNDRRNFDTLLELNPGSTRVYVGYRHSEFEGPAFLTQDFARDEFLVFAPVDRETDDVRAGIDLKVGGWDLSFEQSYRKHDSRSDLDLDPSATLGNNPGNNATLTSFARSVPLDGEYWISRGSAHASFAERVDLSLRFVYSDGETEGSSTQSAAGTWFTTGAPAFTETVGTDFSSDLPSSLAEVGVSVRLSDSVYVHDTIRYHEYEIEGSTLEDLDRDVGGTPASEDIAFDTLTDWESWSNRLEAEWRLNRRWTLRGGYLRLDRDVSFERTEVNTDNIAMSTMTTVDEEEGDQTSDTYFASLTFRDGRRWSAFLELWDGETDNVFLRVDPSDFQLARLRGRYRASEHWSFSLSASYRDEENRNPDDENDVDSRTYSASADYTSPRFWLSTGYTAVNLDSSIDIVFCTGSPCPPTTTAISAWSFANSHYFANATLKFNDRFKGSLRSQITDSRDSFPVDYYFVEPRLSVRLYSGYWLNLGYYRYEYDQEEDDLQDYRAEGAILSFSGDF